MEFEDTEFETGLTQSYADTTLNELEGISKDRSFSINAAWNQSSCQWIYVANLYIAIAKN